MTPAFLRALIVVALWGSVSEPEAQLVSAIRAEFRSGQTCITWQESLLPSIDYRVYRAATPITSAQELASADLLGQLDDRSSRNQGRSLASGVEHTWVLMNGGAEMAADRGLFVYTVEALTGKAYYAVTSVQAGVEDTTVLMGANATPHGLFERPQVPQPVLQSSDEEGELWAHWVSDRPTPFAPALSPWPSQAFNFRYEPGTDPGPRGLVVRLHAAGQTYGQGWPQRFEVPADVDILALSDLQPYGNSFWFGAQDHLPSGPSASTRVWDYTEQRVLWTVDQLMKKRAAELDPERVYAIGGSMGAIGTMYLVGERPELFAAVLCRNGLYDLLATDYRNPEVFESLFGSFDLDLPTRSGIPILERTNAAVMATRDPGVDWPVIRTISGRNDETAGWMSAVELFQGLATAHRPAVHYFDERTHSPMGYWQGIERALLVRTFLTRRDRPSLRFDRCSLDDDPGDGTRADGDPIGGINAYVDYDPRTASATDDALTFDVHLRDQGALDDAPAARGWAALTPRRTGPFVLAPGDCVHYTLQEGGELVDEHLLFADELGLLHTPLVPLTRIPREARFEHQSIAALPPLFLGRAPLRGDALQVVLHGTAGDPWTLFLMYGGARGAFTGRPGMAPFALHGTLGADGLAERWIDVPARLPDNAWVLARALLSGKRTPAVRVDLQNG